MAFKSKAQRRKFAQLLVEGKISDEVYEVEPRDGTEGASGAPPSKARAEKEVGVEEEEAFTSLAAQAEAMKEGDLKLTSFVPLR